MLARRLRGLLGSRVERRRACRERWARWDGMLSVGVVSGLAGQAVVSTCERVEAVGGRAFSDIGGPRGRSVQRIHARLSVHGGEIMWS